MSDIRLMATDLDGTLIGSVNEFPLYTSFREKISVLRRDHGLVWAACTGRSLNSFREFFSPMRMMDIMPDFVVLNHAYIYSRTALGYLPHVFWNFRIFSMMWASQLHVREAIDEWHDMITGVALGVTTIRRHRDRLCLRFDAEDSAIMAANLLKEKVKPYRHLQVYRYLTEVDVRTVPFTKGLALSELAQHLDISREQILAIGNGHNDISMLDGSVAGMVGCPSNSEYEVMSVVHKAGGHVAGKRSLSGVLEIMEAYEKNQVCSDLPSWWKEPSQGANPKQRRTSRRGQRKGQHRASLWIFAAVVYTILLVFASLELIPFSNVIIKPYSVLVTLMQKFMDLIIR